MRAKGRELTVVFVLIAALLAVAACGSDSRSKQRVASSAPPVERTLPPLPARSPSPKLRAMHRRASDAASSLRGLKFRGDVSIAELSGWEYGSRTSELTKVLGGEDLRSLSRLGAAGGVLPDGVDLAVLAGSFTAVSAGAVYSPLDKQVLIIDRFNNDSLLTHEFTHALQDQHFDLIKLFAARPYNFDRAEALFAVIEGDAVNVQRRLEQGDAYGRRNLDDIARDESNRFGGFRREAAGLFPPLLTETFIFRYREGSRFVEAIRRSRGQQGVDELFRHPPASSEQILHLEKYEQNELPRDVSVNESLLAVQGWKTVTSTPLGEIGIRGLLMAGVSEKDAAQAANGWGGDRAYLFERPGAKPLFVWKTVWDSRTHADEFFDAYQAMLRKNVRGVVSRPDQNTVEVLNSDQGRLTIVRRIGDSVIVARGSDVEVRIAIELTRE